MWRPALKTRALSFARLVDGTYPALAECQAHTVRRIKPALSKASSSFPMLVVEEEAWSGDRMTFRVRALGQVAAGTVDVADDHVQLEVTLPWLLHKFAQIVQQTIAGRGRILLEKR